MKLCAEVLLDRRSLSLLWRQLVIQETKQALVLMDCVENWYRILVHRVFWLRQGLPPLSSPENFIFWAPPLWTRASCVFQSSWRAWHANSTDHSVPERLYVRAAEAKAEACSSSRTCWLTGSLSLNHWTARQILSMYIDSRVERPNSIKFFLAIERLIIYKTAHRIWLRILSTALEKELKVLTTL
ncbi:hypothetical protein R6Z07M_019697 [Ovis aries]